MCRKQPHRAALKLSWTPFCSIFRVDHENDNEHFQPPSESGGGGLLLFVTQVCRVLLREGVALLVPGTVAMDEAVPVAARLLHELDVHVAPLPPRPTEVGGFT